MPVGLGPRTSVKMNCIVDPLGGGDGGCGGAGGDGGGLGDIAVPGGSGGDIG